MATKDLRTLRQEAKAAGIRGFKGMDRDELVAALSSAGGTTRAKPTKKRAATSAPAKKRSTRSTAKRQTSGTRKTSTRKPATRTRKAAAPAKRPATRASRNESGRHLIGKINFSDDDGWNARPGSPRDEILKALRSKKGNREAVFNLLVKRIRDFVPLKKADGTKRTKAEQEAYLRYLISRVLFDFAVKTGQHEPSGNRAEYGTGGTGTGAFNRRGNKRKAASTSASRSRSTTRKGAARKGTARKSTKRTRR